MTKEEFLTLYLCCFSEDTEKDAERMWQLSAAGKLLCHRQGGQPAAMLMLLPANAQTANLYYIFAACTHPAFRRRGLMEGLLQTAYTTALEDGMQGVFLRPASADLTRYYMRRGFVPFCHAQIVPLPPAAPGKGQALDFTAFCAARQQYLKGPHIVWPTAFLQANFAYLQAFGNADGLLVYETDAETLCVRELFGSAGPGLAAAAARQQGCKRILCRRFGRGEPYALVRSSKPLPETYVGLTLDAFA